MDLYKVLYGFICVSGVWTHILDAWLVFLMSGLICLMSELIFLMSEMSTKTSHGHTHNL